MTDPAIHGGDVWRVSAEFGVAPEQLLDFSANVNPRGLPAGAMRRLKADAAAAALLMRYPDPSAGELRRALADRLGVAEESIVVGEGAEALLAAAVRAFKARRCLVPVPAFSEYARACAACGAALHPYPLLPGSDFRLDGREFGRLLCSGRFDLAIVNNPHNPSGALVDADELRLVFDTAIRAGANVLLDEAFIDYAEHASLARDAARRPGVIVVRSLTKFFGCPALRAGYAIGAPESIGRLAAEIPTWPVTLLALNALREALRDEAYARDTLQENAAERARLSAGIETLGARVFPSAANYLLIRLKEEWAPAARLCARLIRWHRILVRNCDSYENLETGRYIRVAVRSATDNDCLLRALETVWKG